MELTCWASILTLGPSIQVSTEAIAVLDVDFSAAVGLNYTFDKAMFYFNAPPNHTSSGEFGSAIPIVNISAVEASTNASVTVKLVPSLLFGLTALGDKVESAINFDMETFATLELSLGTESISGCGNSANKTSKGCLDVLGGVDVSANVEGNFFDLFQDQAGVSLYSKTFDAYQKALDSSEVTPTSSASAPGGTSVSPGSQKGGAISLRVSRSLFPLVCLLFAVL